MNVSTAIRHGLRQAVSSPKLLLLLWLVNLLCAVPMSLMMRQALADSFGSSLVSRGMLEGFDLGWHAEYESRAGGFESTFQPTVSGPGPVLDNLEAWWSGGLFEATPGLIAAGLGYALLWAFLLGGVLDHLARGRALALDRFAGAGGRYLPRFVGLALLSGVAYFLIYKLAAWVYRRIAEASGDVTVERTVFAWVLLAAVLTVALMSVVRMVFDYAKIAAVTEERSGLASAARGLRFVFHHPLQTFGVYFGLTAAGALLLALGLLLAPGTGQSTLLSIVFVFVLGQVYLIARLVFRVTVLGAQMNLFRELGGVDS